MTEGRWVLAFGRDCRHIGAMDGDLLFWAVAVGLAGVTAALLVLALLGRGRVSEPGASDLRVYRDQLDEVERDLARGTLAPDEAGRVRTEVSRRLIEADRADRAQGATTPAPRGATIALAVVCGIGVLGGALAVYARLGAPGYPDLPLKTRIEMAETARANRPGQTVAEAEARLPPAPAVDPSYETLMAQLRTTLNNRPDDAEGHALLARNEAALGNFAAAARAQERLIAIRGAAAGARDFTDLAEFRILATGGYVSPEAETALTRALGLDGNDGRARYYSGLLYAQTGRPDLAFRLWRGLLDSGPEEAPWIAPIRAQIDELASLAGVRYDPPAPSRGPSAGDVAAAAEMTPAERTEMIRGMVAGLADRLARRGGPPEDWARLIAAYGVLGETDTAATIWAEAQQVFAGQDAALERIAAAARQAGAAQ